MLGRKDYTREEIATARSAIGRQLDGYDQLVAAVAATGDPAARQAVTDFEPLLTQALVMELDRFFVHRVRTLSGKDTNPLTEVELLVEGLLGDGTLRGNKVIKYVADSSVVGVPVGQAVALRAADLRRLVDAFLLELEARSAA